MSVLAHLRFPLQRRRRCALCESHCWNGTHSSYAEQRVTGRPPLDSLSDDSSYCFWPASSRLGVAECRLSGTFANVETSMRCPASLCCSELSRLHYNSQYECRRSLSPAKYVTRLPSVWLEIQHQPLVEPRMSSDVIHSAQMGLGASRRHVQLNSIAQQFNSPVPRSRADPSSIVLRCR
ncbi:hypothetical protein RB213_008883 [Colletotrichum asianum]